MAVTDFPGASDLIAWFGQWPAFHDAEVVSITLDRGIGCTVVIHALGPSAERNATVTFRLEGFPLDSSGLVNTRIEGFNHQNVLSSLTVHKDDEGYELRLDGIHGVDASIRGERISASLAPV